MLPTITVRNLIKCSGSSLFIRQFNKTNHLSTISCYHHHFHRKDDIHKNRKTGFVNIYSDLHRAIHSNSALHLKCSNLLEQKVNTDETKKEKDDKISDDGKSDPNLIALEEGKKLGLFARFKRMAKDYWYVLIPVHVVTSSFWLGAFYYTSKR